jgi:hypothetical protein
MKFKFFCYLIDRATLHMDLEKPWVIRVLHWARTVAVHEQCRLYKLKGAN